jgi:hypothetical protein
LVMAWVHEKLSWRHTAKWWYISLRSPRHWTEVYVRRHAPAALLSGKTPPLPIVQKFVWAVHPVWTLKTIKFFWACRELNSYFLVVSMQPGQHTDWALSWRRAELANLSEGARPNYLWISKKLFWCAHGNFEEKNKVLEPFIIIIDLIHIIIILRN